jgi:hypothetical protein
MFQFIGGIQEGQTLRVATSRKNEGGSAHPPSFQNLEKLAYGVTSFTCVAIYQIFPNGSVTAPLRSP